MITALVLDALACYRLTRFVTADVLSRPLRDQIIEAAYDSAGRAVEVRSVLGAEPAEGDWSAYAEDDDQAPKIAELVVCRWCTGAWVAVGIIAARRLAPRAWDPIARALSFSAAAALLAGLEKG